MTGHLHPHVTVTQSVWEQTYGETQVNTRTHTYAGTHVQTSTDTLCIISILRDFLSVSVSRRAGGGQGEDRPRVDSGYNKEHTDSDVCVCDAGVCSPCYNSSFRMAFTDVREFFSSQTHLMHDSKNTLAYMCHLITTDSLSNAATLH